MNSLFENKVLRNSVFYVAMVLSGMALMFGGLKLTGQLPVAPASSDRVNEEQTGKGHEEGHVEGAAGFVMLTSKQLKAGGVTVETAKPEPFSATLELPGQLQLNSEREARVIAPLGGRVRSVPVQVGMKVKAGAVLATLESRELAEASAGLLAARERRVLAESTFQREEGLWQKKISAEQDYLAARRDLNEARIAEQGARQKLLALDISEADISGLRSGSSLAHYSLRAPLAGTVLTRDLTLGESLGTDKAVFRIADLSSLWIELSLPATELALVQRGQRVFVSDGAQQGEGRVLFVQPELDAASRTGSVRVEIDNRDGRWRPGQFLRAQLLGGKSVDVIAVPATALILLENRNVVFVEGRGGFEAREVRLGRKAAGRVEILNGLAAGERYASGDVFLLKAELGKGEASHDD
jgi:cobalt-zinc-cadmium efflux system membrane fusion protein